VRSAPIAAGDLLRPVIAPGGTGGEELQIGEWKGSVASGGSDVDLRAKDTV
jgi:hypothetical protein